MKLLRHLILGLALVASVVLTSFAQQNNPYNGNWLAKFTTSNGRPVEAEVIVKDAAGTWTRTDRNRNPCAGLNMPIAVARATASEFEFSINGSKMLTGCSDVTVTLKRIDDKTLEGQNSNGRKITLVRQ